MLSATKLDNPLAMWHKLMSNNSYSAWYYYELESLPGAKTYAYQFELTDRNFCKAT